MADIHPIHSPAVNHLFPLSMYVGSAAIYSDQVEDIRTAWARLSQSAPRLKYPLLTTQKSSNAISSPRVNKTMEYLRQRSEERRGGKGCVRTCGSRWSPDH